MFYRAGDWDDLQSDLHVSLKVGFKIQFAGIVPVFLEFNVLLLPVPNNFPPDKTTPFHSSKGDIVDR